MKKKTNFQTPSSKPSLEPTFDLQVSAVLADELIGGG